MRSIWVMTAVAAIASGAAAQDLRPSGRLPLMNEIPAEGTAWGLRVSGEPLFRVALERRGPPGGMAVLEIRDPSGAVFRRTEIVNLEMIEIATQGKSGLWTFHLRPGAVTPPLPPGFPALPARPEGAAPATAWPTPAGRSTFRFDALGLRDRSVYPVDSALNPTHPPSQVFTAHTPTLGDTASATAARGPEEILRDLEAAMTAARGGTLDEEGRSLLVLLRRYLDRSPPPAGRRGASPVQSGLPYPIPAR